MVDLIVPFRVFLTLRPSTYTGALAKLMLGTYYGGNGNSAVPVNHKQALKWYRASSKGGSPAAPFFIALMHIDGTGGVEESDELARSLLKQSAELGYVDAQEEYAHLCWWGRGGEKRRDISVH